MRQMSQKKKQRVFAKFIEPEYDRVFHLIDSSLDHDCELAQAMAQDVMELAWKQLGQLPKTDSAWPWLTQITQNEMRKYHRARGIPHQDICDAVLSAPTESTGPEQEAIADDSPEMGGPAALDRRFMETKARESPKHKRLKRILAIMTAIVFLICACVALSIAIFGQKTISGYQSILGLEKEEPEEDLLEQTSSTIDLEITDEKDIADAAEFVDNTLYMPTYLPEGFAFEKGLVSRTNDGPAVAECIFKNGDRILGIIEFLAIDKEDGRITGGSANGELIRLEDRVLYVSEGAVSGEAAIDVITEDVFCTIWGDGLTREEVIKIGKGMKLFHK